MTAKAEAQVNTVLPRSFGDLGYGVLGTSCCIWAHMVPCCICPIPQSNTQSIVASGRAAEQCAFVSLAYEQEAGVPAR
eukprot:353000-Chlamydomonas_euryale.AAC.1